MRSIIIICSFLVFTFFSLAQEIKWEGKSVDFSHGKLVVDQSKNFLVFEDGTPFFYLGDTAWELSHRLNKQETEKYLENRREKGFTVIQAVILAGLDGLNTPNAEGEKPLINNDPLQPNEKYFDHVDWVVEKALEKGLFIGMLPTWGDKVDKRWGVGPEIFDEKNAFEYGKFVGERYRNYQNIIWINGGDRLGGGDNFVIWDALAKGIRSVDNNHLMTFHPQGERSSSEWFHRSEWLDFNMLQSGHHQRTYAIYKTLLVPDYNRYPKRPVIDGEPRYEDHPVGLDPESLGWFDDVDIRQSLYWSLFSGAFGYVYGCHAIWQMLTPQREPLNHARNTWEIDLDLPGAWDVIHARRLLGSRPYFDRVPYQSILSNDYIPETDYVVATRGTDYIFIYTPTSWIVKVNMERCGWLEAKAWWYNPRNGETEVIGKFPADGEVTFKPPTRKKRGNDWILVLDNADMEFPEPGSLNTNV